jgi:hypothetical protein
VRAPYNVAMFYFTRSPIAGDVNRYVVWRRPYRSVAGHAQTTEGARVLVRYLTDRHKNKECACARTGRVCCDERGYVPNRATQRA